MGIIFKIKKIEFKVTYSCPSSGKVSRNTKIRCYRYRLYIW